MLTVRTGPVCIDGSVSVSTKSMKIPYLSFTFPRNVFRLNTPFSTFAILLRDAATGVLVTATGWMYDRSMRGSPELTQLLLTQAAINDSTLVLSSDSFSANIKRSNRHSFCFRVSEELSVRSFVLVSYAIPKNVSLLLSSLQ